MNWTKFLDETMGRIGTLQAQTPKMFEGFNTMGKAAKKSGALDEKTKEFIALGIARASWTNASSGGRSLTHKNRMPDWAAASRAARVSPGATPTPCPLLM